MAADVRLLLAVREDRADEIDHGISVLERLTTNPFLTESEQHLCGTALQMLKDRQPPDAA